MSKWPKAERPSFQLQVPLALAFQSATHNIIPFINLTNISIANNNKSLKKCILRVLNCVSLHNKSKSWLLHRHVSTQWLLKGYMSAQYVLCGHMSVQYALSGQFLLVPLILLVIVNVLVDTSAQIKVTKGPERGQIELSTFAAATTVCLWMARTQRAQKHSLNVYAVLQCSTA